MCVCVLRKAKTIEENAGSGDVPSVLRNDGSKQSSDDSNNSGRIVVKRVEEDNSSNRPETASGGERVVEKGQGETGFKTGSPPVPSRVSKKTAVGRPANKHEDGYKKAIVEVFDRVNTPETLTASAAISGDTNTAFSVLPDSENACECPDCRAKLTKKLSTSKPLRPFAIVFFRIYYLNEKT